MPELIQASMVHIINTPLYGTIIKDKKNKKFIPIYNEEDKKKYTTEITRYKGLGEMDPLELYSTAIDPNIRCKRTLQFDNTNINSLWKSLGAFTIEKFPKLPDIKV